MRAHLVQFDISWEDPETNHRKVREIVALANPEPGDLVLLPEMFDTGFSFSFERTADTQGRTLSFLASLARGFQVTVQGGRTGATPDERRGLNLAPVIGPDGTLLVEYAKIHPFSFGREHERFQGGDRTVGYRWEGPSDGLNVMPAICYDLRFPELFRRGLISGAEVFCIGANWPEARQSHWRGLLIARAIENQAFVLGVNRTGRDPTLCYAGGSLAVGPRGEILAELGHAEGVLSVTIDPSALREWRGAFPAWHDMRLA